MANQESPLNCTSKDFEKAVIERLRYLASFIPLDSQVFREPWGSSTVLCIDFEACPELLAATKARVRLLAMAASQLGLANSIVFKIGKRTICWEKIDRLNK